MSRLDLAFVSGGMSVREAWVCGRGLLLPFTDWMTVEQSEQASVVINALAFDGNDA